MGKTLRIAIYILALGFALWIWRIVYTTILNILSFQVDLFRYLLQWQEFVNSAWNAAQEIMWWLMELFWESSATIKDPSSSNSIQDRLESFSNKLKKIAMILWVILWGMTYLIITKLLFWIKTHIHSLKEFIS